MAAPVRTAQVSSCSPAAARNVSPAAISTLRPSAICWAAILARLVVLPAPLTPTIIQMFGVPRAGSNVSVRDAPPSRAAMSLRSAATSAAGSVISRRFTRSRSESSRAVVTFTPKSARSIASSRSSQVDCSMELRRSTPVVAVANTPRARARRSRNDAGATGAGGATVAVSTTAGTAAGGATRARRERTTKTTRPATTTATATAATRTEVSFTPTGR